MSVVVWFDGRVVTDSMLDTCAVDVAIDARPILSRQSLRHGWRTRGRFFLLPSV